MPAHAPATSTEKNAPTTIVETIQKKPAWLIPIIGGVVIVILLTAVVAVPSPKRQAPKTNAPVESLPRPSEPPPSHDADAIPYLNNQFGFSLYFPKKWAEKYSVAETTNGVSVKYTASGNVIELFTIEAIPEETWRTSAERPYLISSKKGIVFTYTTPSLTDNPFSSTDSANLFLKEYRSLLGDVPKLMQSFEFTE